ncbi:hypothetical protein SAMN04515665_10312 [Blastococcus sp. DSM 46786]|uniref:DUF5947 family protein n=1 Tax=Blastococcus sp. DSM 46786 TaxID=1798227 RepID=UPI0008CDC9FD|nr:DUF5947 family protein [Blastococcus sp. DSM 46786]SEK55045.1 hypothetical protein SAMN04515665_10312 [Blastococcus sp. DSM 46786]
MSTGALERVVRRSASPAIDDVERCDMCGLAVPEQHRHVLDQQAGELMCTCQACTLLFQRDAAGRGHYQLVPETRQRLADLSPKELGVPVGLVFFVVQCDGSVLANYPSPMGPTRSEVDAGTWQALQQRCPELAGMAPGVQALLLDTARGADEHWLVPIDDCYRLVAVIKREWRGLSGGSTVWPAIREFFDGLAEPRRSTY